MLISIITITLNNPEELESTINSIPGFEFIESVIVNGGDSPIEIKSQKSYKAKIINEKDKGIADAFNKGIKNSSGDALMFLNSGDLLIRPEYINESIKIFNENPIITFVHSNILYADSIGGELFVKPPLLNLGRGMKYLHPSMIVRKNVFDEIGYFNLNYTISMDFDFLVRMEKHGLKGYYINSDPVVKMEGTGKSQTLEYIAIKECIKSLKANDYLTTENLLGLSKRLSLFFFRKLLITIGGKKILGLFKRLKYNY